MDWPTKSCQRFYFPPGAPKHCLLTQIQQWSSGAPGTKMVQAQKVMSPGSQRVPAFAVGMLTLSRVYTSRSSSKEVRIKVTFFSVVYFSRATLHQKRVKGHYWGGPRPPFSLIIGLTSYPEERWVMCVGRFYSKSANCCSNPKS